MKSSSLILFVSIKEIMTYANRINDRRSILGPKDDLMAISPMKHTWAKGILDRMENNTWFPHVVNMADDVASYNRLNAADRFMFDKALAFLVKPRRHSIQQHQPEYCKTRNLSGSFHVFVTSSMGRGATRQIIRHNH